MSEKTPETPDDCKPCIFVEDCKLHALQRGKWIPQICLYETCLECGTKYDLQRAQCPRCART